MRQAHGRVHAGRYGHIGTACHIGGGNFLTSAHVVTSQGDLLAEPLTIEGATDQPIPVIGNKQLIDPVMERDAALLTLSPEAGADLRRQVMGGASYAIGFREQAERGAVWYCDSFPQGFPAGNTFKGTVSAIPAVGTDQNFQLICENPGVLMPDGRPAITNASGGAILLHARQRVVALMRRQLDFIPQTLHATPIDALEFPAVRKALQRQGGQFAWTNLHNICDREPQWEALVPRMNDDGIDIVFLIGRQKEGHKSFCTRAEIAMQGVCEWVDLKIDWPPPPDMPDAVWASLGQSIDLASPKSAEEIRALARQRKVIFRCSEISLDDDLDVAALFGQTLPLLFNGVKGPGALFLQPVSWRGEAMPERGKALLALANFAGARIVKLQELTRFTRDNVRALLDHCPKISTDERDAWATEAATRPNSDEVLRVVLAKLLGVDENRREIK